MRKILKTWTAFVMLSSLISVAYAAEWKLIFEGAGYQAEIDQESIARSGNVVKAWDRLIPPGGVAADEDGFTYRFIMTWSDYDCASRRVTAYRRIYVGESAREVKEQNPIRHPVVNVTAGTPREKLWAAACNVALKPQATTSAKPATTQQTKPVTATKPSAERPARPAATNSQPQLLPNRKDTEISKKPEPQVATKPAVSTKPATQVKPASTEKATAVTAKPENTTRKPATSTKPVASTKPASAAKEPAKTKEPEKQSENVYQYLQNQLREGRSGEVIIMTTKPTREATKNTRQQNSKPNSTRK